MKDIATLSDLRQLDAAVERSHRRPVWIFKHSLVCGISSRAWCQYREFVAASKECEMDCAVVEIQNARDVTALGGEPSASSAFPRRLPSRRLSSAGRAVVPGLDRSLRSG